MKILSLDSATQSATCALVEDSVLLGEVIINHKLQHSIMLMPMIDEMLRSLSLTIDDVDGFALSKGPGSFTGLRIGMATIKGLSQSTGKPFLSLSTLEVLAHNLFNTKGLICPVLDALRGNLYTALYTYEEGNLVEIMEPCVLNHKELIEKLCTREESVTFVGEGTEKYGEIFKNSVPKSLIAPAPFNVVRASSTAALALKHLSKGESDNVFESAPIYLMQSHAEAEYERKSRGHHE